MKVLFLDIDGVLNDTIGAILDEERVALINDVVRKTGANVVLSSSWAHTHGVDDVLKRLRGAGFVGKVVGRTRRGETRGEEIQAWLDDALDVVVFAAVDDSAFMHPVSDRWVKTSGRRGGITREEADEAIAILRQVPTVPQRNPTRAAIDKLAARFELRNEPLMQDWEYEVADAERIDEFLDAYRSAELDDDERFTIMETLVQSNESWFASGAWHPRWPELLDLITANAALHASTIVYWALVDEDEKSNCWAVTPFMRRILQRRRELFDWEAS